MGYFNFWYNFKYFLRRMPKKILVAICIFLIICIAHLKGYCTDVEILNYDNTDVIQAYKLEYDTYAYKFIRECITIATRNGGTLPSDIQTALRQMARGGDLQNYFNFMPAKYMNLYYAENNTLVNKPGWEIGLYVSTSSPGATDTMTIEYSRNNSTTLYGQLLIRKHTSGRFVGVNLNNHSYNSTIGGNYCYLIQAFANYIPSDLVDTVYQMGYAQYDYNMAQTTLTTIDNHIQELEQELSNMNTFIQDDTVSQYSSSDLPSDSMNDITASGFNNIFTRIYNSVTSNSNQTVTITIPYLDYPVSVNSYFMYNTLNNNGFGAIITIIDTVYFGLVSLYIIKDIYKYINQIKNGDIGHTDTNIKTEVL